VDLDLEKFLDRVNHDILMARLARRLACPGEGWGRQAPAAHRYNRFKTIVGFLMKNGVVREFREGLPYSIRYSVIARAYRYVYESSVTSTDPSLDRSPAAAIKQTSGTTPST
jgi:hypothetical protein